MTEERMQSNENHRRTIREARGDSCGDPVTLVVIASGITLLLWPVMLWPGRLVR